MMIIRTAQIHDTPAIVELWTETNLLRPWNKHERDIEQALSTETSTILVAEIENKLIGTIMAGYDGHRGWIYYLAIEPEYQGNGYGKQLVQAAEEWLKSRGAPKIHLLTRKGNEAVQKFYAKIGYGISDVTVMEKVIEENIDVPSPINFHNQQEVEEWVRNTVEKRPYRPEFFAAFAASINIFSEKPLNILEIGSGPGHLAKHILENCNIKHYTLLDFSAPMHQIAKNNLGQLADKATYLLRDFKSPQWIDSLGKFDVIVTMQAAHEVRHKQNISSLFLQLRKLLDDNGIFLYSDHYYTPSSKTKHPELYLTKEEQPEILEQCGFKNIVPVLDKAEMALYVAHK